jgi:hypothetical protein
MSVRFFLKLTSYITSVLGVTLILFPSFIENTFITQPSHGGDIFIRFLGSTLFGYACLNWFAAKNNDEPARKITMMGNLSTLTVAFFISLAAVISGTLNAKGWLIVLLHLTFGTGFAVFIFFVEA